MRILPLQPLTEDGLARAAAEMASAHATEIYLVGVTDGTSEVREWADRLTPDLRVVSEGILQQGRRNAEMRTEVARRFGLYTALEVADVVGSKARNRAAAASRLRAAGAVFAIRSGGELLYPGFQFDTEEGRPHPVVADVLRALAPAGYGGWETASWFVSASDLLEGHAPVDLLTAAPARVVEAATRETSPLGF